MPLVAVGMPSARASAVPMKAATMPTRMVTMHADVLLAWYDEAAEHADHDADQDRGDDAGDGHSFLQGDEWCKSNTPGRKK